MTAHVQAALLSVLVTMTWTTSAPAVGTAPTALPVVETNAAAKLPLIWHDSLKSALTIASVEYQPVLAIFSSPDCPWCGKLKADILGDPETRNLLQHFALVEIDVTKDENSASFYGVRGVPTILILSADGVVRAGVGGYIPLTESRKLLQGALNPEFLKQTDAAYTDLLQQIKDAKMPADKWPQVMIFLGSREKRAELHDAILALAPFPSTNMVTLLEDSRLAVRLGAMEILEEVAGDAFGFDPWLDAESAEGNKVAIAKWKEWAGTEGSGNKSIYSALTKEQIESYVQDLVSENTERSVRAAQMLQHGGPGTSEALLNFLQQHPTLPRGMANRIKEMQYAVILPETGGMAPSVLAHRLIFGTLDVRQKSIAALQTAGRKAVPILREMLADPDPIIRETTVDALVGAGSKDAIPILEEHIKQEKDIEVVYAILRSLGKVQSRKGLTLLTSYLSDSNEDLVISALNSIARLRSKTVSDDVAKCLDDPRWRVRVAALDAIGKLRMSSLADKITEMLKDKDEFVRYSAVSALAGISAKKAAKQLEEVFLAEDGLKGPVASAFVSMDLPLPQSFASSLQGKNPDILLSVIEALNSSDERNVRFASQFIAHDNPDVSCSVIRIIALHGMKNSDLRSKIVATLKAGQREKVLAALESIDIPRSELAFYTTMFGDETTSAGDTNAPGRTVHATSNILDSVLDAFSSEETPAVSSNADERVPAQAPSKTPPGPGGKSPIEDMLDAFDQGASQPVASTGNISVVTSSRDGGVDTLVRNIEAYITPEHDNEIRFKAALLLARLGNPSAIPVLQTGLAERPVADRAAVAASLNGIAGTKSLPYLKELLRDSADSVRTAAIETCVAHAASSAFIDALFEELLRKDTKLKPHEIYGYQLIGAMRKSSGKQSIGKWARRMLAENSDTTAQNLAIVLLETCWTSGDEKTLTSFCKSPDPFQRRASWHALGKCKPDTLTKELQTVARDPSEYVRMVIPNVYTRGSSRWVHFFDKEHFEADQYYWSSSQERSRLTPDTRDALLKLTRDSSAKVRIEAFFCLLSNRESIDLAQFVTTIDAFPDRQEISSRITSYLTSNYQQLGNNFAILVPYMTDEHGDNETVERVRKHFDVDSGKEKETVALVIRAEKGMEIPATFLEPPDKPSQGGAEQPLKLIYFTSPGCSDCARVEKLLPQMKECFQWLDLEIHDIKKVEAMRLNEALSERFGVPENARLITPALFAGAGCLIKKDITFERLGELLVRSATVSTNWFTVPEESLQAADSAIVHRGQAMTPFLIAGNGLMDGVNPCAFATIIFLVSYLQIARRKPLEIAQVAIAFIVGVFVAYFALGLGLSEIISTILFLKKAGEILNWAMAVFVLVFMVLNVRDGILCLQGKLSQTTLQLPGVLKDGIHTAIRRGARHAHFVVAAFVVGIVVSFLELACTGQVYLPTIGYMLKVGGPSAGIIGMLLLYNVAFIIPLVIILGATYFGMTAERLINILQRHAAAVKFATAALFLVLLITFVVSSRISL